MPRGCSRWRKLRKPCMRAERALILCGAREQPLELIQQSELPQLIGPENICDNVQEAIQRAEEIFEKLTPAAKGAAQ